MFEAEGAKDSPEHTQHIDHQAEIRQIRVWLDEFPNRDTYIHGIALDGSEGQCILGLTFSNYRSRLCREVIMEGHQIIGIQANTKAHHDHISRLAFVVQGKGANQRKTLEFKADTARCD